MAWTDSDGTYTIVGLPAGTYTAGATLENYSFTTNFSNPVAVGPNYAGADFAATYSVLAAPAITSQPVGQTVNPGANVTFTVGASGSAPMYYQWRFNGVNIAAATGSSYTKNNVQATNAGSYSVVVSNVLGNATSGNAVLTVNTPPAITGQPQSQSVIAGNNASFTVTASGASPLAYQWRLSGTNIPGATASSYTRNNVQLTDAGNYAVVVTNGLGSVTSAPASLTINFTLTATATYGGRVTNSPNQQSYPANTPVTLTASSVSVFPFAGWSGDASGTNNPLTVVMNSNKTITANFTSPVP
ncbi:MAG TPA: immunoglobulin domain-containing protein, partial [Candidatus Dormibacteraeota bacterium]|nr:immunoglobulin domain-containing protein [Candidatus Dormibacteraeota bacterium]